jgi:hypothetical protein
VTIGVMVVVAVLAISPFVAVLVYEEVGTTVLGFATIIIAFQLIARIGSWRWGVWDGRERVSVRIHEPYPPPLRIVAQMVLLVAAIAVAFVAIVSEPGLTMVAVGIAVAAVLLGVAVDVMDAAHHKRREPGDAMAQGGLSQ